MLLRVSLFLAAMGLATWWAFDKVVGSEVKHVVSVHAEDKAGHLLDMFRTQPETMAHLLAGDFDHPGLAEMLEMAETIHVMAVKVFDWRGAPLGMVTVDVHEDPSHGAAEAGHFDDGHDHDVTAPVDPVQAARLQAVLAQAPDPLTLRAMLRDDNPRLVQTGSTVGEGAPIDYALVVKPVAASATHPAGFIGVVLELGHIREAYTAGSQRFAALFLLFGGILFGVPGLGYWVQRRSADASHQDAVYLSRHDPLTGLLNRTALTSEAAARLKQNKIGAAVFVDMDRFKSINDTHGHVAGDKILQRLSELLKNQFSKQALIARIGGDEFAAILPPASEPAIRQAVEDLIAEASKEVTINGIALSASVSAGVAIPRAEDSLETLLQRADTALYCAKDAGRNRAAFYTAAMGAAAARRRELEKWVRVAHREGRFTLAYQPLVNARTQQVIGYEALLRLQGPDGRPIGPDEFIPVAEDIGLIEELGTWVLLSATRQIAALDDVTSVSVNLSAEQFRSGKLVGAVTRALRSSNLPASRLELEITESLLLDKDAHTTLQVDSLQEMGVSIALDDFGTGYSSLSTLWQYDFDRLKIDKSFVMAMEHNPERSREMIGAIVSLGERMKMSITAEGVETDAQCRLLADMGCDVLQGYYFGKPAPLDTLIAPEVVAPEVVAPEVVTPELIAHEEPRKTGT